MTICEGKKDKMTKSKDDTQKQIDKECRKMRKLFSGNDARTMQLLDPLIQNACFMEVTLRQLQRDILAKGAVDAYQNGNAQSGLKIGASVQAYNAMLKNYNAVICKLAKYVSPDVEPDAFEEFMVGKDPR